MAAEIRIRVAHDVHGVETGYFAEIGDETSTYHMCDTRSEIEVARKDAVEVYATDPASFREPAEGEEYDRDVMLVSVVGEPSSAPGGWSPPAATV